MPRKETNIKGLRVGKLMVISPTDRKCKNDRYWLCKCDCGKIIEIRRSALTRNSRPTKSCGCLRVSVAQSLRKRKSLRKHFKCEQCGSDKYYAKGYCESCYKKMRYYKQCYEKINKT